MLDPTPAPRPSAALELEGRYFSVRPVDPAGDAGPLFSASHRNPADAAMWDYMSAGPFTSAEALRVWLTSLLEGASCVAYTVIERASGRPVGGCVYLNVVPSNRSIEIGSIWYVPAFQRTKANTEIAYLLMRHAFDALGYRRVEWKCNALNDRSRAAALRLGFQYEGTFRQHMIVKGKNRDTAWFSVIDAEWPAIRGRLERWLYATPTDGTGRPLSSLTGV